MRSYPLFGAVKEKLLQLKKEQLENRKLFKSIYIDSDYVFTHVNGKVIPPDYATQTFNTIIRQKNLRKIRFHDLKHSCAAMLISLGYTLKDIQEWLGHSDIKMTGNIYGHLEIGRKMEML